MVFSLLAYFLVCPVDCCSMRSARFCEPRRMLTPLLWLRERNDDAPVSSTVFFAFWRHAQLFGMAIFSLAYDTAPR
jgi:hypothetical protein